MITIQDRPTPGLAAPCRMVAWHGQRHVVPTLAVDAAGRTVSVVGLFHAPSPASGTAEDPSHPVERDTRWGCDDRQGVPPPLWVLQRIPSS
jgi:hypothetical protein